MQSNVKQCLEEVARERQRIWLSEPEEIRKARSLKGTYGNRYIPFELARGDLQGCADALSCFVESLEDEQVDLTSLKIVTDRCLEFYLRRMREWYKQHTIEGVLRNVQAVLANVESKEEYKQLIRELHRYVGKLSWWFDLSTPWLPLTQLYELIVPE